MILLRKGTKAYEHFLRVDCFFAGLLGMRYGDRYSISAQCYRSKCWLCAVVRHALNLIQEDHCKIACDLEGLKENE